ncbi:MAG: transposase [Vampirovibrio sp.]|nr:transposase [Vampirovibrio sp.]
MKPLTKPLKWLNNFWNSYKRWIVERTFAWLTGYRRLSKDFERTISSAEAFVKIAHCKLLLNRLSKL